LTSDLVRKAAALAEEMHSPRVVSIRVRLGAYAAISPEHLRAHFEHAARGTRAAGARLVIETVDPIDDPGAEQILLESVELAE
jgi:hydrogenase nickel incorporation protein HypA/HybF